MEENVQWQVIFYRLHFFHLGKVRSCIEGEMESKVNV